MNTLKTLLTSQRAMAMVISVVAGVLSRYGYDLDADTQTKLASQIFEIISASSGIFAATRHVAQKKKAK